MPARAGTCRHFRACRHFGTDARLAFSIVLPTVTANVNPNLQQLTRLQLQLQPAANLRLPGTCTRVVLGLLYFSGRPRSNKGRWGDGDKEQGTDLYLLAIGIIW
jgi:hypothetical protein